MSQWYEERTSASYVVSIASAVDDFLWETQIKSSQTLKQKYVILIFVQLVIQVTVLFVR